MRAPKQVDSLVGHILPTALIAGPGFLFGLNSGYGVLGIAVSTIVGAVALAITWLAAAYVVGMYQTRHHKRQFDMQDDIARRYVQERLFGPPDNTRGADDRHEVILKDRPHRGGSSRSG